MAFDKGEYRQVHSARPLKHRRLTAAVTIDKVINGQMGDWASDCKQTSERLQN